MIREILNESVKFHITVAILEKQNSIIQDNFKKKLQMKRFGDTTLISSESSINK